MCGRYMITSPGEAIRRVFDVPTHFDFAPRYNIAPTQDVVVWPGRPGERRRVSTARWGLVSPQSPDLSVGARMINARSETVAGKVSFRWAFRNARCLIPADGFYEWGTASGRKQPYYIGLTGGGPFAMAGVWELWTSPEGRKVPTCAVLTTTPNELVRPIHDRMPVILTDWFESSWLNREDTYTTQLKTNLRPYHAREMEACAVE